MNVSICIPTYNQALYLEQAVRSAAQQTLAPAEIIVSDDCSTDETPDVLRRLAAEIPYLTVIRQPINLGIARNTDSCLRKATGDFVIRLDSDDRLGPDYAQKLVEQLVTYPDAGYAHAAIQEISQHDTPLQLRRLYRKSGYQSSDDALQAAVKGYRVAANIIMFRRTALEQVDYLANRPNYTEDYHVTTALAAAGYGNVYLDQVLAYYRVWVDTARVRQRRKLSEITGLQRVFGDVLEPAFMKRGWALATVKNSRTDMARLHADCLGWNVYSRDEKAELTTELLQLSSAPIVKLHIWLYTRGFGKVLNAYYQLRTNSVAVVKKLLLSLRF